MMPWFPPECKSEALPPEPVLSVCSHIGLYQTNTGMLLLKNVTFQPFWNCVICKRSVKTISRCIAPQMAGKVCVI
jgi:hypothetical protein